MYHPQLYTFIKVAENKSFAKAADSLYLSRVSVMRQINALEERTGVQLLERNSSGVQLTPAGVSFYHDALKIMRESEEAVHRARRIAAPARQTIRVGASLLNPCQPLVALWEDIREESSSFRLKIVPYSDDHENVLRLLSSLGADGNFFDVVMAINDSRNWSEISNFLPVQPEPIVCAVPISHPLASRKSLTVKDFDGQQLMMVSEGDSPANVEARAILRAECSDLDIIDVGNYYDVDVFHMCVERNCLLLSFSIWEDIHPSLVTIPIEWGCNVPYGIMYPKKPSRQVTQFIERIRTSLGRETSKETGGRPLSPYQE